MAISNDNADDLYAETLGVAEAKRRFSELIDRVAGGERFVVARHGKPALVLIPPTPEAVRRPEAGPVGLAAMAGALSEWDDIDEAVRQIYVARRSSPDRPAPTLD